MPANRQDMHDTARACMFGLRITALLLSLGQWMDSIIWRDKPPKATSSPPRTSAQSVRCSKRRKARLGARFHVNHPYEGLYSHVNLIDCRTGLSLLYICSSVHDTNYLVKAALNGDRIDRVPTCILDPSHVPKNIPESWD